MSLKWKTYKNPLGQRVHKTKINYHYYAKIRKTWYWPNNGKWFVSIEAPHENGFITLSNASLKEIKEFVEHTFKIWKVI